MSIAVCCKNTLRWEIRGKFLHFSLLLTFFRFIACVLFFKFAFVNFVLYYPFSANLVLVLIFSLHFVYLSTYPLLFFYSFFRFPSIFFLFPSSSCLVCIFYFFKKTVCFSVFASSVHDVNLIPGPIVVLDDEFNAFNDLLLNDHADSAVNLKPL